MAATAPPDTHPEIDWSKWSPPSEGDVRSPCPALNALANHHILPHDGKNITRAMAVEALSSAIHLDSLIGTSFAIGAVLANPKHSLLRPATDFDLDHLDKHNYIEHDVSLSREDFAFGSTSVLSEERLDELLKGLEAGSARDEAGVVETSWAAASHVRYARVLSSRTRHEAAGKQWTYGMKEATMSYGESALYLNVLGVDGAAPVEWVKVFFGQERLPYNEGWRPPAKITQSMMNHGIAEMLKASEDKGDEAKMIGVGTVESMWQEAMAVLPIMEEMSAWH